MKEAKGTMSSCWRRRTLTNRIIPGILQAFIVVAGWEVAKSLILNKGESNALLNRARSIDQTKCPPTDISQATSSSFLDISSVISVAELLSSRDRPLTYHLKVDVYAREEKYGALILYPAGALVNFGVFKGRLSDDSQAHARPNNMDVRAAVGAAKSVQDTSVRNYDSQSGGRLSSEVSIDYAPETANLAVGNKLGTGNIGQVLSSVEKLRPRVERDPQSSFGEMRVQTREQDIYNRNLPQTYKQSEVVRMNANIVKSTSKPSPYLKMLNQKIAKSLTPNTASQTNVIGGIGAQQFLIPGNIIPEFGNNYGSAPNSENALLSRGILTDERGDRLYSEGFLDRVNKLSNELFGTSAKNVSHDGTPLQLIINSPSACSGMTEIEVVFLINSEAQNVIQRQNIRDTYVNPFYFPGLHFVHVFLIGKATSQNMQQRLNQEQALNIDIVQGDFLDTPDNATLKGLMGMRWVTQFCVQAKYIMKVTEDVFVDTDKLITGLIPAANMANDGRVMFCYFMPEGPITRTGPKAISEDLFPGRFRMRPYCKGFAVLMTRGVVATLLAASDYVRPIKLDEIYLYGILPFVSGVIEVYDVGSNRAFHNYGIETVNCYKTMLDKCSYVASIAFKERFTNLWDFVKIRMQHPHNGWENERSLWDIEKYKRRF